MGMDTGSVPHFIHGQNIPYLNFTKRSILLKEMETGENPSQFPVLFFPVTNRAPELSNRKKEWRMPAKTHIVEGTIEDLVERARKGNREVLEEIVRRIQDRVYGLAIRMLYIPADAEDATQEILVKVITHLSTFKEQSRFETWVYRIASNHLLTECRGRAERWRMTFDVCRQAVEESGPAGVPDPSMEAEQSLICEEMKRACVHYLLLCLNKEHRLAFILGEIIGVSNAEGASILGLTPAAYRQRVSRGKRQVLGFLARHCGLADEDNPCRCETLAAHHVRKGYLDPEHPLFAEHPCRPRRESDAKGLVLEMGRMAKAARVIRNHPDYEAPGAFVESMKRMIESNRFRLLEHS